MLMPTAELRADAAPAPNAALRANAAALQAADFFAGAVVPCTRQHEAMP